MEQSALNDLQIIKEVLGGNINTYSLLMQKYNQRLYRICKGYLKDEAEIEDVMQDVYVKAFQNLKGFEGRSEFGTWVTRILINESLQRIKMSKRSAVKNSQDLEQLNVTDNINPENKTMSKELKEILEKNIEMLPHNYRIVFVMREIEKMNVADTAEALVISESNVKVRLNRAKELLRKSLMKVYPLEQLYEFNLVRCGRVANNVLARISAQLIAQQTISN